MADGLIVLVVRDVWISIGVVAVAEVVAVRLSLPTDGEPLVDVVPTVI